MSTATAEPEVRVLNTFNTMAYYEQKVDRICREGVPLAAVVLDEHIPGWHLLVTRPIEMQCVNDCVLGQVFGEEGEDADDLFSSGYAKGVLYLRSMGVIDRPFVFSSEKAAPYWGAEISRRMT